MRPGHAGERRHLGGGIDRAGLGGVGEAERALLDVVNAGRRGGGESMPQRLRVDAAVGAVVAGTPAG
jgi:hypothetical protein